MFLVSVVVSRECRSLGQTGRRFFGANGENDSTTTYDRQGAEKYTHTHARILVSHFTLFVNIKNELSAELCIMRQSH